MEGPNMNSQEEEPQIAESATDAGSARKPSSGLGNRLRSVMMGAALAFGASSTEANAEQPTGPDADRKPVTVDTSKMSQTEWQEYQDKIYQETDAFKAKAEADAERDAELILNDIDGAMSGDVFRVAGEQYRGIIKELDALANSADVHPDTASGAKKAMRDIAYNAAHLHALRTNETPSLGLVESSVAKVCDAAEDLLKEYKEWAEHKKWISE